MYGELQNDSIKLLKTFFSNYERHLSASLHELVHRARRSSLVARRSSSCVTNSLINNNKIANTRNTLFSDQRRLSLFFLSFSLPFRTLCTIQCLPHEMR